MDFSFAATWLNSKTWFRPALAIATGLVLAFKTYSHNQAVKDAMEQTSVILLALGAGSFGVSNSGIKKPVSSRDTSQ